MTKLMKMRKNNLKIEIMTKVLVIVEGGVVRNILTDQEIDLMIIDYDVEDVDPEDLISVTGGDGGDAYLYRGVPPEVNPERVKELFEMKEQYLNKK